MVCFSFHCCCHWGCLWTWWNLQPMTCARSRPCVLGEVLKSWRRELHRRRLHWSSETCLQRDGCQGLSDVKGQGVKSRWSKAICSSHRRTCILTTTMLWDRSHWIHFFFVLFLFLECFWAFGFEGFEQKWCQDLCQTTMIGLFWLVLFQVIVGLLLLPMLVCVGQHREGMVRPSARMTTLNQGRQRLPGGKARLVSNSTRGQVSAWGFHVNASIGKDGCATNERQVNSTHRTPSLTGSGAAWRTR